MSLKKESIVYSSESESEEEVKPQIVKRERKALTEEQKQNLRDRLAKAREAKKAKRDKLVAEKKPRAKKVEEPVELTKKSRPKKVVIVEPEGSPPEIKKTRKKKVVVEEPEPEPVVEEEEVKPKRKYVRKPKISFNPF